MNELTYKLMKSVGSSIIVLKEIISILKCPEYENVSYVTTLFKGKEILLLGCLLVEPSLNINKDNKLLNRLLYSTYYRSEHLRELCLSLDYRFVANLLNNHTKMNSDMITKMYNRYYSESKRIYSFEIDVKINAYKYFNSIGIKLNDQVIDIMNGFMFYKHVSLDERIMITTDIVNKIVSSCEITEEMEIDTIVSRVDSFLNIFMCKVLLDIFVDQTYNKFGSNKFMPYMRFSDIIKESIICY